MSALPLGWRAVTLGELADAGAVWFKGGYPSGFYNEIGDGVPHLRPFNVSAAGDINMTQVKSVAAPAADSPCWLRRGDVIFNNTNSEDLVGKTALFDSDERMVLSNHMTIIRPAHGGTVDGYWMARCLHRLWDRRLFKSLCRRYVGQASIDLSRLKSIGIILPPLPEQHAIANALRAVQDARDARRRELALERERKAALMEDLFTYGIRKDGAVRSTDYGSLPTRWAVKPLAECASVQTGAAKGRDFKGAAVREVPYLRVANVQDGYLDLTEMKNIMIRESEINRYRLQDGDVVLTEGGDFDKLGRGFVWSGQIPGCIHQNHVFAVRGHRGLVLPHFLAYLAASPYGKAYFLAVAHKTTNLACINATKLKAFPVPLPPLDEQCDIADVLTACDRKIAALESEAAVQDELFRALLEELMTGRLSALPLAADAGIPPEGNP